MESPYLYIKKPPIDKGGQITGQKSEFLENDTGAAEEESGPVEVELEAYISEAERQELLSGLHSRLGWLGKVIPYEVELSGKKCRLHEKVWELVNREPLTEADKIQIEACLALISEKEEEDEQKLRENALTRDEARELFKETAGLLRAIAELKEIRGGDSGEKKEDLQRQLNKNKVEDARRWVMFLKETRG